MVGYTRTSVLRTIALMSQKGRLPPVLIWNRSTGSGFDLNPDVHSKGKPKINDAILVGAKLAIQL